MAVALERRRRPAMPPVSTPAASAAIAAIRASTTSTSIRVNPGVKPGARRRAADMALLVLDVRVDAGPARLAVRAEADQVERLAFARRLVHERAAPRILQLGRLRVRAEPTG